MDYDEVTGWFRDYEDTGVRPGPTVEASPARRLRDTIEPIAMHSVWSRRVNESQKALGLDFGTGYVWGRAAALGEPDPGVVVSSFAVFEPLMVTDLYERGRACVDRQTLQQVRTTETVASLTEVLASASISGDELAKAAEILQVAAAGADGLGRPLYSGFATQAWPDDPVGRLWHGCELLREHRGDSHVAVCAAHGLDAIEMNILTELWLGMPLYSYTATRGWSPEVMTATADRLRDFGVLWNDELTDGGRAMRDRIEQDTDALQVSVLDAIGDALDEVIDIVDVCAAACVAASAFPPDPFKRAAG